MEEYKPSLLAGPPRFSLEIGGKCSIFQVCCPSVPGYLFHGFIALLLAFGFIDRPVAENFYGAPKEHLLDDKRVFSSVNAYLELGTSHAVPVRGEQLEGPGLILLRLLDHVRRDALRGPLRGGVFSGAAVEFKLVLSPSRGHWRGLFLALPGQKIFF